ncbi:hypothetical protein NIES593_13240 [Hydrococcus rivularis NIES-593]|uniref:Uncharacterized protein n=1 Tax=Hydrococcus rivularis NIES-593 TaxID=1921803 RepID=A0A1U7HF39_9CYAN|nr:hypothetical protein [Hydrococcus rivularis]OKH22161.1 hypothetical protein NIES593_13240 [Hydrococcus rivularis NIES-593]
MSSIEGDRAGAIPLLTSLTMNGSVFLQQLRANPVTRSIPIVLLTAQAVCDRRSNRETFFLSRSFLSDC